MKSKQLRNCRKPERCAQTSVGPHTKGATKRLWRPNNRRKKKEASHNAKAETPKAETPRGGPRALQAVLPVGLNAVTAEEPEWEELEVAVDSAATETVIMSSQLINVQTTEGKAFKQGVQYEVADGTLIPNLDEKHFVGVSEGGHAREVAAQICDVNKAVLSVKKVIQAGNKVVFDSEGRYIEDKHKRWRIPLQEQNGMFLLKLWVRKPF